MKKTWIITRNVLDCEGHYDHTENMGVLINVTEAEAEKWCEEHDNYSHYCYSAPHYKEIETLN